MDTTYICVVCNKNEAGPTATVDHMAFHIINRDPITLRWEGSKAILEEWTEDLAS